MADVICNIARGRAFQFHETDATKWGVMLLKAAQADDTLRDYDDLAAILAVSGNTEANFTNYARKTGLTSTKTVDDTNNRASLDFSDLTWTSAGGTTNNSLVKAILFYDQGGTDATRIPIYAYDFVVTTNGEDLFLRFDSAGAGRSA